MKRDYDFYLKQAGTPKQKRIDFILGASDGALGINFLIVFFFCGYDVMALLLGLLWFAQIPLMLTDKIASNRDIWRAAGIAVISIITTIIIAYIFSFPVLYLVLAVEILVTSLCVVGIGRRK